MQCVIYKGSKKRDTYLYVEAEQKLKRVPASLLAMLGELNVVMELELTKERTLAGADIDRVRNDLATNGYYLQLPSNNLPDWLNT